MTDKELIHSKWQVKIMRVLASSGLKELSFSDSPDEGIEFIRDGYKMELILRLSDRKDNGRRMLG